MTSIQLIILFYGLLFVVAFLYASVGHGGASGYLALMALFGLAASVMKPGALLLNLFVSLVSFIQFYRAGHFKFKLFWPLALASVPLAFVGGLITIDDDIYKKILGAVLVIPALRFAFFSKQEVNEVRRFNMFGAIVIGILIGFLSGLIGIGGGILLSPILLFLRWADMKETAAISALFIFVNSLAGLGGQLVNGLAFSEEMIGYVSVAFIGGLLGAYFGARRFNATILKYLLAAVLGIAAVKLLMAT